MNLDPYTTYLLIACVCTLGAIVGGMFAWWALST